MPNTKNCDSSVRFGRANFIDQSEILEVLICVIIKLFLWLLQIVAEMVRNLVIGVMAYVYCISKLVGNISYGRCGVIQDVCYSSHT